MSLTCFAVLWGVQHCVCVAGFAMVFKAASVLLLVSLAGALASEPTGEHHISLYFKLY